MPKKPHLSEVADLVNFQIHIMVEEDQPPDYRTFVQAWAVDDEGRLLEEYREEIELPPNRVVPVILAAKAAILADLEITEGEIADGKDRRKQRREERAAEDNRKREEQEAKHLELAQKIRDAFDPEAEEAMIEQWKERLRLEAERLHPPQELPELPAEEQLADVIAAIEAEAERARREREEAGLRYDQEQAERDANQRQADLIAAQAQAEAEGVVAPVAPPPPPRRPN